MTWRNGPLLGFDLETTGVDTSWDVPVQVALVWTLPHEVVRSNCFLVDPGRDIPEEAVAIHGITTEQARTKGCCLEEAALRVHTTLLDATAAGVPVVAMNANFDVTIAERLFQSFGLPALPWEALIDPLVLDRHCDRYRKGKRRLDALCEHYRVRLHNAHNAGADAEAAVGIARRLGYRFRECGDISVEELTRLQAEWHEEWAIHFDLWRRSQGLPGLGAEELRWPCRRPTDAAHLLAPSGLGLAALGTPGLGLPGLGLPGYVPVDAGTAMASGGRSVA